MVVAKVLLISALSVGATGAVVAETHSHSGANEHQRTNPGGSDQCALPLAQRTGGWIC